MPLRALHLPTKNVILASDFNFAYEIRRLYKKEDLICPFCEERMIPVKRGNSIIYFRHYRICKSKLEHDHDESPEHLSEKCLDPSNLFIEKELRFLILIIP